MKSFVMKLKEVFFSKATIISENEVPEKGMRFNKKTVQLALDLHQAGMTLREIQRHLAEAEHVKVSHVAILRWVRKAEVEGS